MSATCPLCGAEHKKAKVDVRECVRVLAARVSALEQRAAPAPVVSLSGAAQGAGKIGG